MNNLSPLDTSGSGREGRIFSFASSYANYSSATDDVNEARLILSLRDGQRRFRVSKMVSAVLLPVLALTVVISVVLASLVDDKQESKQAKVAVSQYVQLAHLCKALNQERNGVVEQLIVDALDLEHDTTAIQELNETDEAVRALTSWAKSGVHCFHPDCVYSTKKHFETHLPEMRETPESGAATLNDIQNQISAYVEATTFFTKWAEKLIKLPESDDLRNCLVAANALLRAYNTMALKNILGVVYFTFCTFEEENYHAIWKKSAEETVFLEVAFNYFPSGGRCYEIKYLETLLHEENLAFENLIDSRQYEDICPNAHWCRQVCRSQRVDGGQTWALGRSG